MLLFITCLIIIIIFHETAHLIVAKLCKCDVEKFSIGFGPAIIRKKIGGTIYQLSPILLGGYNKLKGELKASKDPKAFTNLPYRKKCLIAMAGIIVNILTGLIAIYLGMLFNIYNLIYFGFISIMLGITNAIPFPALDGSYLILVWLEKIYGKEKGYFIMGIICKIGFIIIMMLNIIFLPILIMLIRNGGL